MSWSNCRSAIVGAVEALTPASKPEYTYRHVEGEQIEDVAVDRAFVVRMTDPPAQVGQVLNGSSWRWLTSYEVVVFYARGRFVEEDEDRIAEDLVQLQQTLLTTSLHANMEGYVPRGDGYTSTTLSEDESRNYLVSVGFTLHHL